MGARRKTARLTVRPGNFFRCRQHFLHVDKLVRGLLNDLLFRPHGRARTKHAEDCVSCMRCTETAHRDSSAPMTSAVRYEGMGTRCSNVYVLVPSLLACEPVATALIKAVRPPGTVIEAVYGHLTPGESWHGSICLLYTSPSPRDGLLSRMPSSA